MNKPFNAAEVMAAIKANHEALDKCPKHAFAYPTERRLNFGEKLTCRNCGGLMDAVQAFRYCQGFKAAGGNPNEVIEGFE
jgi:hypothetical protein